MENYESIKAKLLKLQALVENGYKGEAIAAKRRLESLCRKYGVSIEDILREKEEITRYEFETGSSSLLKTLFKQCYFKVLNKKEIIYYNRSRSKIAVDLTPLQYAELSNLFEWHKVNFKKDMEKTLNTMLDAYLNKHDLFSDQDEDNPEKEIKPEDFAKIFTMLAMMDQLSNNSYHKMIEQEI